MKWRECTEGKYSCVRNERDERLTTWATGPADRALIAAAPELLAVCEELLAADAAAFRVIFNGSLTGEFVSELQRCGIEDGFGARAKDAITKAKGET